SVVFLGFAASPAWARSEPRQPFGDEVAPQGEQQQAAEPERLQNEPPVATPDRAGKGYEPALPLLSNCTCASTNGTCNTTTCTITCNQGFFNCDNSLANGCEATASCTATGTDGGTTKPKDLGTGASTSGGCDVAGASASTAGAMLLVGSALL